MSPQRAGGRFAPTPSGALHAGSLVAAVGSWMEARRRGGSWHLRFDDLDRPRVAAGAEAAIRACLQAFGLHWDSTSHQSLRRPLYHAMLHALQRTGLVYPCACSRREIELAGRPGADGPIYPGTCRTGMPAGRPARVLRLRVSGPVCFTDLLQGAQRLDLEALGGDFPLYRLDGTYSFHLATAVDDACQGFDPVVRGADLLETTARQILVQRLLGLPSPAYLHLPVAVDTTGAKLSKQTRAAPLDPGQPLPALRQALAFLGQDPPPATITDLAAFWRDALARWDPGRIAPVRTLVWPPARP